MFPFCIKTNDGDKSFQMDLSDHSSSVEITWLQRTSITLMFVLGIYNLIRHANEAQWGDCRENRPPAPQRKEPQTADLMSDYSRSGKVLQISDVWESEQLYLTAVYTVWVVKLASQHRYLKVEVVTRASAWRFMCLRGPSPASPPATTSIIRCIRWLKYSGCDSQQLPTARLCHHLETNPISYLRLYICPIQVEGHRFCPCWGPLLGVSDTLLASKLKKARVRSRCWTTVGPKPHRSWARHVSAHPCSPSLLH